MWFVCSNCKTTEMTWSGRCPSCGEWNTLVSTSTDPKLKKKKAKKFTSEVDRQHVVKYLKYRKLSNQPIKIYYKDDTSFRVFYQYNFDDKYIHIPSGEGYSYKYLIDRVRNVVP